VYKNVIFALILIHLVFTNFKLKTLAFVIYISIALYIMSVLKILLFDPRPFFTDIHIKPLDHYAELGNPSGIL